MIFRIVCFLILFYFSLSNQIFGQDKFTDYNILKSKVDSIAAAHRVPSIGFAMVNRDSILVSGAVGVANREENIAATEETVYRVGSVTKSFIAIGILKLVQDGIISLDDQITDLVPEITIQNRWSDQSPVLLRHLLEHTSGFRDLYIQDFVADEEMPLPSMEESIQRRPDYWVSRWEPGTRHAYSNPGYSLLGVIINKFSGRNYDQYLKDILLDPLLMKNSDFLGRNVTNLAMSYDKKGNPQVPSPLFDHSAGFLHSTPRDMARFVQFMLNEGSVHNNLKVLDPEIFHKMESPSSIIGADLGLIGYGMANYAIVSRGFIGYGHNGGLQEYLSSYVYFPDPGNGYYFTLTNSNFEAYEAVSKLFQSYCLPVRKRLKLPDRI
jgi:CubicO group peptidase (beta-lactamase class C family)